MLSKFKIIHNPNSVYDSISYFIYDESVFAGSFVISTLDNSTLLELFIEEDYRRCGIGSFILNHYQIKHVQCTTWNEEGINFYKANGFEIDKSTLYLIDFKRNWNEQARI